jgi:AcrR family transcriptional regulator
MPAARAYRRPDPTASEPTRAKIMSAVRDLLEEGVFQEATVADVAKRAGVSRATLYQHFGSRLGLVDGICDTLSVNPALQAIRRAVDLDDPADALDELLEQTTRFWASEEGIHRHLYGLAVIDSAAADFVTRQRADRRGELDRLVRKLHRQRALRAGVSERHALHALMILTSFATYDELREHAGLSPARTATELRRLAREQLL